MGKHPGTRRNAMPAAIDTPELIEYVETHDLHIEKPLARRSRPGFWRTLAHGITKHLTPMPHEWQAPSCSPRRPSRPPWTGSHGSRAQLRVRGLGQDEQGIKASVDPGESQV